MRPRDIETDYVYDDVIEINKVKEDLLILNQGNSSLETWSGDPCLPDPWQGLACNFINGSTVITDLNLSNNDFSREIPSSSNLTSLDISNNELEGSLPQSLLSLPHLRTL
ncbi:hypothetical protein V6N13_044614 [Hibiscus sabdariffa]